MKRVAIVFPTMWDEKQLAACRSAWQRDFEVELGELSDEDCPSALDPLAYIEQLATRYRGKIEGVTSSSDYPGAAVAAAVAKRLGLPGTEPQNVIRCSHKYYSRLAQQEIAPEATARFQLVEPGHPSKSLSFPCYVKPVKGAFSIMSQRIENRSELETFLAKPAARDFLDEYVSIFNRLVRGLTDFDVDGRYFLAEEPLDGRQVTVEGFVSDGSAHVLGIVDSVCHARTKSFLRFDYPSSLSPSIQQRMESLVSKLVGHLGLAQTLFNVELMYDESRERIAIVEINPRMCGQFADLYEKVDGTSGYEVALALAVGEAPRVRRGAGVYGAASSCPLRIFEHRRVARAPSPSELSEVEEAFPHTLVWSECKTGDALSDFESVEDGKSARYGVVNLGASDRGAIPESLNAVLRQLDYRFEPV